MQFLPYEVHLPAQCWLTGHHPFWRIGIFQPEGSQMSTEHAGPCVNPSGSQRSMRRKTASHAMKTARKQHTDSDFLDDASLVILCHSPHPQPRDRSVVGELLLLLAKPRTFNPPSDLTWSKREGLSCEGLSGASRSRSPGAHADPGPMGSKPCSTPQRTTRGVESISRHRGDAPETACEHI